jgi:hypothetical protein
MERMTQIFGAALLAGSLIGGAQAAGDQQPGQPGAGGATMQPSTGSDTGVRDMDTNAQRAHSPTAPGAQPANADKKAQTQGGGQQAGGSTGPQGTGSAAGGTRDWASIDANKDGIGTPDEYEKVLGQKGGQK